MPAPRPAAKSVKSCLLTSSRGRIQTSTMRFLCCTPAKQRAKKSAALFRRVDNPLQFVGHVIDVELLACDIPLTLRMDWHHRTLFLLAGCKRFFCSLSLCCP